ncbi:MAG: M23 family metallopeptidase [Undibacterium sp.]|nr:M23 family metallopeptidase [Undibacterium sp.]
MPTLSIQTPVNPVKSFSPLILAFIALTLIFSMSWVHASPTDLIHIENVQRPNSQVVTASNTSRVPISVNLILSSASNFASNRAWPIHALIAPGKTVELAEVYSADRRIGFTYYYNWTMQIGDPSARPAPDARYIVPFIGNRPFQVSQAVDGPIFSHNQPRNKFAIDIPMPIGTTIVAARAGYVIERVMQFDEGKAEQTYYDKANFIRILHDDGTWAEYAHLKNYSSNIYPGQRIDAGVAIGLSGNSGFSTEPHLHFQINVNDKGKIISLPFQFWSKREGLITPSYKKWIAPS